MLARAGRRLALGLTLWLGIGIGAAALEPTQSPESLLFGIAPVFMVDQSTFLAGFGPYLEERLGRTVRFVRRKSYAEITDMLLGGELDAAWICSFSYVLNRTSLSLVGVPVFQGEPYYQSYLVVPAGDIETRGYADLKGKVFAYVEPRSNTGYLYPRYAISQLGTDSSAWFRETFFTWSHPDSVHAVADRVADAAAVDGYIWEVLRLGNPALTDRTRVVSGSPKFGFPPVVAGPFIKDDLRGRLAEVLLGMDQDPEGRRLLALLHLDRFMAPREDIYDGIAAMIRAVMPVVE
jgi:phosphonate transport system substrate-binding protein